MLPVVIHPKTAQLQIRVSETEKAAIQRAAARCGLDMSAYVLSRVLSAPAVDFQRHVEACAAQDSSFALAELNSFLTALAAIELREATAVLPVHSLTPYLANYVAAMVEYACGTRGMPSPAWTNSIAPLLEPVFATNLVSLRLYLLTHSPPPFRRRNIFIDSTLGHRV